MSKQSGYHEQGSIIVLVLSLIIVVVVAATAFAVVMHKHKKPNNTSTTTTAQSSDDQSNSSTGDSATSLSVLRIKSHNVTRKQDVSELMAATEIFIANNRGNWPTDFSNGQLTGAEDDAPSPVRLQFYTNVTVLDGVQDPLKGDGLQLVTNATCSSNNGTAASTSSRSYAVLYAQQNTDGTFTPACMPSSG